MKKHTVLLAMLLAVTVVLASTIVIHPARAKLASTIYFAPDNIPAPALFPTNFVVNITGDSLGTTSTSGINGWDIIVNDGDPSLSFLTPVSVTVFIPTPGNLLSPFGGEAENINCINNGSGIPVGQPGDLGCTISDAPGLVHTSVTLLAPATPFPVSGLIAQITYQALNPPTTPLTISITSQTITDGSPTPVPVTTRVAVYNGAAADFSVSSPNPAAFNPGSSGSGTVTVTSLNSYTNALTATHDIAPATGLTISCSALSPNPIVVGGTSSSNCSLSSTLPGVYGVTFNVTDGTLFHLSLMTVRVGDFAMSGTTVPVNFVTGGSAPSAITVRSLNGFAGTVGLRNTVIPPTGLTVACPGSVVVPGAGSAPAACTFSSSTPGTYSVTVFGFYNFTGGTTGSIVHTFVFTINVRDFTISATTPVSFVSGGTGASTSVTLTPKFGFTGTIALSAQVTPVTGLTVGCGANIVLTTTTIRMCTLTSSTPNSYAVVITGTCSTAPCPTTGLSHAANVAVTVTGGADFSIAPSTPVTVNANAGATGVQTITVTPSGGFAGTVSLAVTTLPTGLSCQPITSIILPATTSTLSCSATVAADYTLTVTGTSGSLTHTTAAITFHVVDFSIAPSSPTTVNVNAGVSGSQTVTVTALNGFTGTVSLAPTSVPSGLSCQPIASVTPPATTSSLSCTASVAADYTLTVTGTSGSLTHLTAVITFHVVNFSIAPSSPVTVSMNAGANGMQTITVTALNGFTGTVNLAVTTLPTGLTCGAIASVTPPTTTSTLSCSSNTPADYTLTVTGTSGTLSHATAAITFHVVPVAVPDFNIAPSSPVTVNANAGSAGVQTITITAVNGFSGTVSLAVTSLPTGLTCQPIASVTPPATTSSLSCMSSTAADYTLTVTGTSGTLIHLTAAITFHVVDFSIAPSTPATVNVNAGASGAQSITVTALNGFTGTVSLAVTSVPTGLICQPITSVTPPATSSSLSCSATVAADYTLTVTGTSGSLTHVTATITFHVVDFSIAPSTPVTVNVNAGANGMQTITVTPLNSFSGTVALTVTSLPSGLSCGALASVTPPATTTSTLSCSSNTPTDYTLTVTGTSGSLIRVTAAITFHVVPVVVPDFNIAPSTPVTVNVNAGATGSQIVTITRVNGFAGTVSLAVTVLPTGLTCQPIASVTPPATTSTLSCSATAGADYTLTVTGTSGSLTHTTAAITFHVVDFTIAPSAPTTVTASVGANGMQTITVAAVNGFTGTVALAVTSVPTGLTCQPIASVTPPATASSLSCSATVAADYTLTVTGTSGSLTHTTAAITFHVVPVAVPDFNIAPSSPVTVNVNAGAPGTQTITITAVNGFSGTVSLTVTSLPTGLTCQPIASVTPPATTSSLSCMSIIAADYTLTVTGTSGSLTHTSAAIKFHVVDFTLSANPTSIITVTGSAGTSTISVQPANAFNAAVSLAITGPATIPPQCTVVLNNGNVLTVTCTAAAGFTVTVTGSSGSLSRTVDVPVTVTVVPDFSISIGSVSPTSIDVGSSGTATVTVHGLNGFSGSITLTVNAPAGLTCPSLAAVTLPPDATRILSCSSNTANDYTVSVTGVGGGLSRTSNSVTFHIVDFTVGPASPVTVNTNTGVAGVQTITVTGLNGFAGTVNLAVTSLPSGLTCQPLASVTPPATTSSLSCMSSIAADYTLTVTGSDGTVLRVSAAITFHVTTPVPPDFTITATTPISFTSGQSGVSTIVTVTATNGFTGTVGLTATVVPVTGLTVTCPASVSLPTSATSANCGLSSTTPGSYTVTITGTSGSLSHSASVAVTVTPVTQADFTLSSTPTSITVVQDTRGAFNIQLTSNNFAGTVTLKAGVSPRVEDGVKPKLVMSSLLLRLNGVNGTLLRILTDDDTPIGVYTVTVTATSGSISHTIRLMVTVVNDEKNFNIVSNSLAVVAQGSSLSRMVFFVSDDFSGTLQLSLTGTSVFGDHFSVKFRTDTVTLSSDTVSTTVLTLTADDDTPVGTFGAVILASSGGVTNTFALTVQVTS